MFMRNKKSFLYAILSMLTVSSLAACSSGRGGNEEEKEWEEPVYEIGDTVKAWSSTDDFDHLPMGVLDDNKGSALIDGLFGNGDKCSLSFEFEVWRRSRRPRISPPGA